MGTLSYAVGALRAIARRQQPYAREAHALGVLLCYIAAVGYPLHLLLKYTTGENNTIDSIILAVQVPSLIFGIVTLVWAGSLYHQNLARGIFEHHKPDLYRTK